MRNKGLTKRILALVIALMVVMTGVVVVSVGAATISVSAWDDLESQVEALGTGDSATYSVTSVLTADSAITVKSGSTVTIQCGNSGHTSTSVDIKRAKDFHGNLFVVEDGAVLNIKCCISGSAFSEGNWQGFFTTNDNNKDNLGGDEADGYYGQALIFNQGELNLIGKNAVLRHNYNPYSNKADKTNYYQHFYRSSTSTTDVGWSSSRVHYPTIDYTSVTLGSATVHEQTDLYKGGAIYNKNGICHLEADSSGGKPQIYACVAEFGGAVCTETIKETDNFIIYAGQISQCVARQKGGAVCGVLYEGDNAADSQAERINLYIGSDGGAKEDVCIAENRAPQGGGIYSNVAVTVKGGTIQNNRATGRFNRASGTTREDKDIELGSSGGGIHVRGYSDGSDGSAGFGNPTLTITGDTVISGNIADTGAGVYLFDYAEELVMTGGVITGNKAGSISYGTLKKYRTISDSKVYPADYNGDGVVDYIESANAGNIYSESTKALIDEKFELYLLGKNKSTLTEEAEVTSGDVSYTVYNPEAITFTDCQGDSETYDVIYNSGSYKYYVGISSDGSSVVEVYKDGDDWSNVTIGSEPISLDDTGPYGEDEVSSASDFGSYEDLRNTIILLDELENSAYYNSKIDYCYFDAVTNPELIELFSDVVGRGGGIYSNTNVTIRGGTIGGENTVNTTSSDVSEVSTFSSLGGNIAAVRGGGIYMNGGTLTVGGTSIATEDAPVIEGNLTDENGGGIFVRNNPDDSRKGKLLFYSGTVKDNAATLNYDPTTSTGGGGSGGGIHLSRGIYPSIIGSAKNAEEEAYWPVVSGNQCLNYGGGICNANQGSVSLDEDSTGGYDIDTAGLYIYNAKIFQNKTGLNYAGLSAGGIGRNYSSGGGISNTGSLVIEECDIYGNYANTAGAGVYNSQYREGTLAYTGGAFKLLGGPTCKIHDNGYMVSDVCTVSMFVPGDSLGTFETVSMSVPTVLSVAKGGAFYFTTYGQPGVFGDTSYLGDDIEYYPIEIYNNIADEGAGIFSYRWIERFFPEMGEYGQTASQVKTLVDETEYGDSWTVAELKTLIDNNKDAKYGIELRNCKIYNNAALRGGGISLYNAGYIGEGTEIYENDATEAGGGGVRLSSSGRCYLDINGGTKIYNNTAKTSGGGILNYGTINITDAEVYGNIAEEGSGGGVCNAQTDGGAVYDEYRPYNYKSGVFARTDGASEKAFVKLTITGTEDNLVKIYDNEAPEGSGGGLYYCTIGEPCKIEYAEIYGNTAGVYGGGICTYRAGDVLYTYPDADGSAEKTASDSKVSISYTTIRDNTAGTKGDTESCGGGIYWSSKTVVEDTVDGDWTGLGELSIGETVDIHDNTTYGQGGGVCVDNGSLKMTSGEIYGNTANSGGGVATSQSALLTGGIIRNNTASFYGGGVYSSSVLTVEDGMYIQLNTANQGGGILVGSGGRLSMTGGVVGGTTTNANNETVSAGNTALDSEAYGTGGGIKFNTGKTVLNTISGGEISNNTAETAGGGLFINGKLDVSGGAEILNNTATRGGGISGNTVGPLNVSRSLIDGNIATTGSGGGIYLNGGFAANISDGAVFTNNKADDKSGCGGAVYSIGTLKVTGGTFGGSEENGNSAYLGGAICGGGEFNINNETGTPVFSYNEAYSGGAVYIGNTTSVEVKNAEFNNNTATFMGGAVICDAFGTAVGIESCNFTSNTARHGGGVGSKRTNGVIIKNCEFTKNTAENNGGGIYIHAGKAETIGNNIHNNSVTNYYGSGVANGGELYMNSDRVYNNNKNGVANLYDGDMLTINSGYFYNNSSSGLYVNAGNAIINGGYFGFSDYTSDSDYTVSHNTVAQIIAGANGTVDVTGENAPRVISALEDGETIGKNIGVKNAGTFTVTEDCKDFDIYGIGTSVSNTGTFTANGTMRITTSAKAGETTEQNRLGILNDSKGTVNLNSDLAEISYCGYRGVDNQGTFNLQKGSIHHCSTDFIPDTLDADGNVLETEFSGGGVVNTGTFEMSGGAIHNNRTGKSGGGIVVGDMMSANAYNHGVLKMSGGEIYSNTSGEHGGGVAIYTLGSSMELTGGTIGGSEDKANTTVDCGGGIYVGDATTENDDTIGTVTINGGTVSYNKAEDGAGIAFASKHTITLAEAVAEDGTVVSQPTICYNVCESTNVTSGGGIYVGGDVEEIEIGSGVKIHNNKSFNGGGVYFNEGSEGKFNGAVVEYNYTVNGGFGAGVTVAKGSKVEMGGDTTVQYNESANQAGGVSNAGTLTIKNASINNNTSVGTGGGIANGGTLNIQEGAKISLNTAGSSSAYKLGGGVLSNGGTINMTGGVIGGENAGNKGSNGAGVVLLGSAEFNMSGGEISYNEATGNGGGINVDSEATFNITGGEIGYNTAKSGAGIYNAGVSCQVENAKIHNNTATGFGGGIHSNASLSVTENTEIYNNNANVGGGISLTGSSGDTSVTLDVYDSKIYGNVAKRYGGGINIHTDGKVTISNTVFGGEEGKGNISNGVYDAAIDEAEGGAGVFCKVFSSEDSEGVFITDCEFSYNEAAYNGGAFYTLAPTTIKNLDIHHNTAGNLGGGIAVHDCGSVDVGENIKVHHNEAGAGGGGIYNTGKWIEDETFTQDNGVKIYNNTSDLFGGGIFNQKTYVSYNTEIFENTAETDGGGVFSERDTTFNNALIRNNTAANGGGICSSTNSVLTLNNCSVFSNNAGGGAGIYFKSTSKASTISDCDIYGNTAKTYGGGIFNGTAAGVTITRGKIRNNTVTSTSNGGGGVVNLGLLNVDGVEIFENTAANGGGIHNFNASAVLNIKGNSKIYDNTATSSGGGVFNNGTFTIEDGFVYNNLKGGVYVNKGTGTINGGYYGFSLYKNGSDYEVSRNTVAQIITASGGACEVTGKNKTRIISALADGETIDKNIGIKNGGTFTVIEDCEDFDIYGTGTGVSNTGTFTANGAMRITSSAKAGETTEQNRLGILNGSKGTVNLNSDLAEVSYCGYRGVNNEGVLNIAGGEVHHNTSETSGGGIYNIGTLSFENALIHDNTANVSGGGVYNAGTLNMSGGVVRNNTARNGAGLYNTGTSNIEAGEVSYNTAIYAYNENGAQVYGGGIENYSGGVLNITGGEIHHNVAEVTDIPSDVTSAMLAKNLPLGGGIYNNATMTLEGVEIYENTASDGGGIYNNGTTTVDKNVIIRNNHATRGGGGVWNVKAWTEVDSLISSTGVKIFENSSDGYGAGYYDQGTTVSYNAEIYENTAVSGGGGVFLTGANAEFNGALIHDNIGKNGVGVKVSTNATLAMNNSEVYENDTTDGSGGGIDIDTGASSVTLTNCKVYNNDAVSGGGIRTFSEKELVLNNTSVYNNTATRNGGGLYAPGSGNVNIVNSEFCENGAGVSGGGIYSAGSIEIVGGSVNKNKIESQNLESYGGGVYIKQSADSIAKITGTEITENASYLGGGVYVETVDGVETIISGANINNNESYHGGGIYQKTGKVVVTDKTVVSKNNNYTAWADKYDSYGAGIFVNGGEMILSNGSEIKENTTLGYGGGLYVRGVLNIENGDDSEIVKIHNNEAQCGGGIFLRNGAVVNMLNGEIYENSSTGNGAGVFLDRNTTFNMSTGSISDNNITTTGTGTSNGVHIYATAVFNMYGGEISNNTGRTDYGVYVMASTDELTTPAMFSMSNDAIVTDDNIVYLGTDAYISVPSEFTGDENIRAIISGADMVTGRVVAKNTGIETEGSETLNGTEALYHNADEPVMTEQYFALKNGKMLRAGNQGASKNEDSGISDEDVFISEKYTITFDMNPEAFSYPDITHTIIDVGEWEFPDSLLGGYVNEDAYPDYKYWYEDATINLGVADSSEADFAGWNTMSDGSGDSYEADEDVSLVGNEDVTYYAQWFTDTIEINYLGNGATEGDDFTDTNVSLSGSTYILENGKVDEGDENVQGREVGEASFERVEDVTDEDGNVIETKLFSFEGWSFTAETENKDNIMKFGGRVDTDELLSVLNPANDNVTAYALLRSAVATENAEGKILEKYEGVNDKSYANVYAVWDQYPKIYAVDRTFTLEEAKAGLITVEALMDTEYAFACDGFDKNGEPIPLLDENGNPVLDEKKKEIPLWEGQNTDFYNTKEVTVQKVDEDGNPVLDEYGDPVYETVTEFERENEESFTIIDYAAEDFTSLKGSATRTLTFCAVDKVGNTTYKTITVRIIPDGEPEPELFSRFISDRYFKDSEGNFVSEANGGFNEESKWVTDESYISVLDSVFANEKDETTGEWSTVEEVWVWDTDMIAEAKQFVEDEGLGNVRAKDALDRFRARFGPIE